MGGYRLAILSADNLPPTLNDPIHEVVHILPNWSGAPIMEGSIPLSDTHIIVGGHLPSHRILDDPDYQVGTLAIYFHVPNPASYQEAFAHILKNYKDPQPEPKKDPIWHCHQEFPTVYELVHQLIFPLHPSMTTPEARATVNHITLDDSSTVHCIHVYMRVDIAYYGHLPIVRVGGPFNHLPLKGSSSPSFVYLSSQLGRPPLESLYLLNVYDCASAFATLFLAPPPPPTPTSRPPPATTTSTTTSTTTTSAEIEDHIPIGRPPASRGSKPYTTRPPPLTSPNQAAKQGWGTSPFPSATAYTEGEYSYPIPDKPHRPKYLPKTNSPATIDPILSVTTRLSNHEARIIALETQLAALTRSPQGRSQGSFATPFRELGTASTLTPTLNPSYPHTQTSQIPKIPTPPAPSANLTSAKHNTAKLPPLTSLWTKRTKSQYPSFKRALFENRESLNCSKPYEHIPNNPLISTNLPSLQYQITIHCPSCSHTLSGFYHPHTTVNDIFHSFQTTTHRLPSNYRITYNHRPQTLTTPLAMFPDRNVDLYITLPVIGGAPQPTSSPNSHTPPPYKGPRLKKPLTLSQFQLRVATLNCNGALKSNPNTRFQILWDFVSSNKIDVLFLIDHRSSTRTLEAIREQGSNHLGLDIRLINNDTTLYSKTKHSKSPFTSYHASVGGCAILTFGSLAHITFPTQFIDPSGANTFIGAKLQPHSSLPPVFLNAVYLFPASTGPMTLNSRIASFLTSSKTPLTPCQWQLQTITNLLTQQHDDHPNCTQIVGGDFNHNHWDVTTHPVTQSFIETLGLSNYAYHAVRTDHLPPPITFPRSQSWIDHILHSGRCDVIDFQAHHDPLITTFTDHYPYSTDFLIHLPTQHHHVPQNLSLRARAHLKAVHIRKHNATILNTFTTLCSKHIHKFTPPLNIVPWPLMKNSITIPAHS